MKAKLAKLALFVLSLAALQQGIAFANERFVALEKQSAVIADNDIDPSALFYTESRLALRAEKQVRTAIEQQEAVNQLP